MIYASLVLVGGAGFMLGMLARYKLDDSRWMNDYRMMQANTAAETMGCPCGAPHTETLEYRSMIGRVPRIEYRCARHIGMVAWTHFGGRFDAQWAHRERCPEGLSQSFTGIVGEPAAWFTCPHSHHNGGAR